MIEAHIFRPPSRLPVLFNLTLILLLSVGGFFSFWQASQAGVGPVFLLYLLRSLLAVGLIPLLVYRFISFYRSAYQLERDGVQLRWGLRIEDIPMDKIQWIQAMKDLEGELPLPRVRWPGSVVGTRRLQDSSVVEFMASRTTGIVLIAAGEKYYAITPADPDGFVRLYERLNELGSLTPIPARSVYPSFLLARFWMDIPARNVLIASLLLGIVLLAWVSFLIPTREMFPLRLGSDGSPMELAPSVRLLLLPVIYGIIFTTDFLGGLYFFRHPERRTHAFVLWGAGLVTVIFFLAALLFIQFSG